MTERILATQAEMDAIFERMEREYDKLSEKQQAFAIREIGQVRAEMTDLLADFSDKDGVIKRQRMARLLRDLDEIERSLRENGTLALEKVIEESSEWTTRYINREVGVAISAAAFDRINKHVVNYVVKRFGEDGLVLSDRVWGLSGEIRDELATIIRRGILRGDGVNKLITDIRPIFVRVNGKEALDQSWKIRRLARNESVTAHRAATSYNAQESDIVKWVRLHDGEGGHKNHEKHRCYFLSNEDRYGKGRGIFKPTDTDIWMPHVQCTSYISYVLDEGRLK